jgi:hypothetical protein
MLTTGERISKQWKERGDLKNGPMFENFIGQHDSYDVYEAQLTTKSLEKTRIYVFSDRNGRLVYSGGNLPGGQARIKGNINVEYTYSSAYKISPREMHAWIEKYIDTILVPGN